MQLAKENGITQKTAWFMLQRLCEAYPACQEAAEKKIPEQLDAIADIVLRYRPKPKTKAAKRRAGKTKE